MELPHDPENSLRYTLERAEMCPNEYVCKNVQSNSIHDSQKVKTTQISING